MSSPSALLDDVFSAIPLVLEVCGFSVSVVDFIQDYVERHDLLYEQGRD